MRSVRPIASAKNESSQVAVQHQGSRFALGLSSRQTQSTSTATATSFQPVSFFNSVDAARHLHVQCLCYSQAKPAVAEDKCRCRASCVTRPWLQRPEPGSYPHD